jgi:hypothetical protein
MLFGFYLTGQMVFSWMSTCVFGPYIMRTCLGEPGAGGEVDTWQGCIFSGSLYTLRWFSLKAATSFFLKPKLGLFGNVCQHIIWGEHIGIRRGRQTTKGRV